jgi:serine/threonine protein kinase
VDDSTHHSKLDAGLTNPSQSGEDTHSADLDDLDFGQTIRGFRDGQRVFGRFRLNSILGRGGMGVVWLGWDERLEENVALKFMPELVRLDEVAVRELTRETRKSRRLTHGNIVRIHDFYEDQSTAAIVMEYVDGFTLSSLRLQQPGEVFSTDQLDDWVRQLVTALSYAHESGGVVHRDLKPSNLMVDSRGQLKITDFGISSSLTDSVSRISMRASNSGSPPYMSPQQILGEQPQVTDDIYSLGATLYELVTGKPPFYQGNIPRQVETVVPPSMAERRSALGHQGAPIPKHWESAITACLEKSPSRRPQSVAQLLEMLDGQVASAGIASKSSTRQRVLAVSLVGATLVAAGTWWVLRESPSPESPVATPTPAQSAPDRSADIASALAAVEEAVNAKNWPSAAEAIGRLAALDPENAQLTALRETVATGRQIDQQVAALLASARIDLDSRRPGEATKALEEAAGLAPDDPRLPALQERSKSLQEELDRERAAEVAAALSEARTALDDKNLSAAESALRRAESLDPKASGLASIREDLDAARARAKALPADLPPSGFFDLDALFSGSEYAAYKAYGKSQILKRVQEALLASHHYSGKVDGEAGLATQNALIQWQRENTTDVSGRLDQETLAGLTLRGFAEQQAPPPPTPKPKAVAKSTPRPRPSATPTPQPTPEPKKDMTVEEFMQKARQLRSQ